MTYIGVALLVIAWGYWMTHGRRVTLGGVMAVLIGILAARAGHDGIMLAAREYARAEHGAVTRAVVLKKISSLDDAMRSRGGYRRRRYRRLMPAAEGSRTHDVLGRLILTGSPYAWIVEYRFPCDRPYACTGRDYVPEGMWRGIYVGQTIDVRRSDNDADAGRLEQNPQWPKAAVDIVFAAALLLGISAASGRWPFRRGPRYLMMPGVVTAVEAVKYRDSVCWRVSFAYFDQRGVAQESASEVQTAGWKTGDDCLAMFPPAQPDLATLRAPGAA
jgi:hypothetical protein